MQKSLGGYPFIALLRAHFAADGFGVVVHGACRGQNRQWQHYSILRIHGKPRLSSGRGVGVGDYGLGNY
ncbi:MAG: hypothetical protein AABZ45_06500 [Pseudomonadota bacterium]